ncbi:pancreatic triacylglycerol lipase [Manduca sexta]|uniref:pancreatic triacylglycerol lipase n=1 Tax=Manduca sexta TaxID=7130 RepID=UPI00188E5619|nr:pancreatic triacylglycerol lipase [Manduca sexta]
MYSLVKCTFVVLAATAASGFNLGDRDVIFHLFTQENPQVSQPLLPSVSSIMASAFSLNRPTVITIHSNAENVSGNFNAFVVPAHLSVQDVNLIAVDWSPRSGIYTEGLANAPQCGRIIADFMNIVIRQFGYDSDRIRIVGVGLGGHIAGIAARHIEGEVPHIIALDPSLHGWSHHPDKLNPDDASVVEVLHTTAGNLGYDYPLGDLDFYPNGGSEQMGCGSDISCSHTYAYAFYAESLTSEINNGNAFVGTACESYEQAIVLACSGDRDATFGGSEPKLFESGIYVFLTNFLPPFARG